MATGKPWSVAKILFPFRKDIAAVQLICRRRPRKDAPRSSYLNPLHFHVKNTYTRLRHSRQCKWLRNLSDGAECNQGCSIRSAAEETKTKYHKGGRQQNNSTSPTATKLWKKARPESRVRCWLVCSRLPCRGPPPSDSQEHTSPPQNRKHQKVMENHLRLPSEIPYSTRSDLVSTSSKIHP